MIRCSNVVMQFSCDSTFSLETVSALFNSLNLVVHMFQLIDVNVNWVTNAGAM